MSRLDGSRALIGHLCRALTWSPLLAGSVVAAGVVWLRTNTPCSVIDATPCLAMQTRVEALRLAAIVIAIGTGFVLDDPAEETTAATPMRRWVVRSARVAIALPVAVIAWSVCVSVARSAGIPTDDLPWASLTAELAALVILALAVSGFAARWVPDHRGGVAAGPVLLVLATVGVLVPNDVLSFTDMPDRAAWGSGSAARTALLGLAAAGFVWSSRDPAARLVPPRPARGARGAEAG